MRARTLFGASLTGLIVVGLVAVVAAPACSASGSIPGLEPTGPGAGLYPWGSPCDESDYVAYEGGWKICVDDVWKYTTENPASLPGYNRCGDETEFCGGCICLESGSYDGGYGTCCSGNGGGDGSSGDIGDALESGPRDAREEDGG